MKQQQLELELKFKPSMNIPFDNPETQIVDGIQKDNDIYVLTLIAQGDYIAKNGKGIKNDSIPGIMSKFKNYTHTASLNLRDHPQFSPLPENLIKNATSEMEAEHYKKQARAKSIGPYVKHFYTTAKNGIHRIWGVFKISDPHYKQAWKNGEFPKYTSSTWLPLKFDENQPDMATDVIPIDNCSVDHPAYNLDMVKIHKECNGPGNKCLHELTDNNNGVMLVQNSHNKIVENCTMMALGKFTNYFEKKNEKEVDNSFSQNMIIKFSEMVTDEGRTGAGEDLGDSTNNKEDESKNLKKQPEQTLIKEETSDNYPNDDNKKDFKSLYEKTQKELEKARESLKEKDKAISEMQPKMNEIDKLIRENNIAKITSALEKVPQEVLSGEQREKELEELVKAVNEGTDDNKMTLAQALKYVGKLEQYTAPVANKMKKLVTNSQKGIKEEPLISNSYPLSDTKDDNSKESGKETQIDFSLL